MAIHASLIPETKTAPGNPIKSQPDISEAPADIAVTNGPKLRPPKI